MTSKQIIWLSFDLGIRGDYESFYAWLDQRGAKECGDGMAVLNYQHGGSELPSKLKEALEQSVKFDKRSRVYVVYRNPKSRLNKGKFIIGSRKSPPWTGYAPDGEAEDDEG